MLFNSYIFIFLFMPVCILGYFLLNSFLSYRCGLTFLCGMSMWFYGYYNIRFLPIIIVSIGVNFVVARLMRCNDNEKSVWRKGLLVIGLFFNVGLLGYFKYTNFLVDNVNAIFNKNITLEKIVLPLGISFFTFQQISFLVDSFRAEVPKYGMLEYASYVAFFPQLIAGPIVTHECLVPQLVDEQRKKINWDNFARGIYLFALGLAKKVIVADSFGNVVNYGFANEGIIDSTNGIIVMLAYTLQIYFDFSGYCDMAMGIGKMLNVDLPLNFDSPYQSANILEFWDRWHMTLTAFFTKYVYIPLGGSRRGVVRTYLNILIVFLISGLWHGAGWNFVVWGMLHGVLSVLTRAIRKFDAKVKIPRVLGMIITFIFVNIAWLIFRAENLSQAISLLRKTFSGGFGKIDVGLSQSLYSNMLFRLIYHLGDFWNLGLIVSLLIGLIVVFCFKPAYRIAMDSMFEKRSLLIAVVILTWGILSIGGISTFLYFDF